jgi:hypothetical protein
MNDNIEILKCLLKTIEMGEREPEWDEVEPVLPVLWGEVIKVMHDDVSAAFVIFDKMLPGWNFKAEGANDECVFNVNNGSKNIDRISMSACADTPAMALLGSTLLALIEIEKRKKSQIEKGEVAL